MPSPEHLPLFAQLSSIEFR